MSFFNLLAVEIRRALHRRLVWALIGIAVAGVLAGGIVGFLDSADLDLAKVRANGEEHPAVMRSWWVPGGGDGVLIVGAFLLIMGGLIGGSSVVGAEWRAGTVTTLLTWEPRRLRLHAARLMSAGLCAWVISCALQALFLTAFVPSVLAHGTTSGTDGEWFLGLVAAMSRISLLTALAAVVGASLATVGRNTTAALVVGWGWLAIGENLVRNLIPDLQRFLLGENVAMLLTWADLEGAEFTSSPVAALVTLLVYGVALAGIGAVRFQRYDVAAA